MAPYLRVLGFTVQSYLLILILAAGLGLWLASREAKRLGLDGDKVYNLCFYALLATVLGARLVYVVRYWSAYRDALLSILSPTPTALAWSEGALIGALVAIVYWNRHKLAVGSTLDAIAPGLTLALALERLGTFLDGSAFGQPTTVPWGVPMWNQVRHPVQLYEMVALFVILGILLLRRQQRTFPGHSFVLLVALYAGSRLLLEAFRANTALLGNGLRTVQLVSLVVLLATVGYLFGRRFWPRETSPGKEGSVA